MLKSNEDYISKIKEVGNYNLKDTHKWRERAAYFQEHGYYCPHVENTADWHEFWDEEERRIIEGYEVDGWYIPGLYYLYLNYLPIYQKQINKYSFPDVYDMDYHTFLCLEHAMFLGKHFAVIKKRQAGFSLKFIVPLIRELWFSWGSPNYIATYEEAQVLKDWDEILVPYREHLNTHTAWYRDFNPTKSLNWRVAKDVETETRRKVTQGRFNTLKGLVLSKSPSKGVGGSAKFIFADEAGVNPVLNKFIGYVKNQIRYGAKITGTIIVSGAVGELKHLEGGLKDIILHPKDHGFYYVKNIWDKNNDYAGKDCGFFVPESWAYYGEDENGVPFVDKDGNSDIPRTEAYILRKREETKERSIEDYNFEISQSPLNLMECFQYRSEKIFPQQIINHQIAAIEMKKDHGTFIDLFTDKMGSIKHKILNKEEAQPLLDYPIKIKSNNKPGCIQIWEWPKENAPYGMYWAGVDITRDSTSLNSPSVHSITIYKGVNRMSNEFESEKIVASYRGRPKDKMDFFKKAMLLLEYYNAEALVENNVRWFIQEAIKAKKGYKLTKSPKWMTDITPNATAMLTSPYGVVMGPKLWDVMIDELVSYVSEVIYVTYDEITGEPTEHFGVERIKNVFVLKEMLEYKPKPEQNSKDNYDDIVSFGLALLQANRAEVMSIIPDDDDDELNFNNNQKNIKLLMRNNLLGSNINRMLSNSRFKRKK